MNMTSPLSRLALRMAYATTQLPRVAWYVGHGVAVRQGSRTVRPRRGTARYAPHTDAPVPDRRRIYADMAALLLQDLANVEGGLYPLPVDHDGSLLTRLRRSLLFF